MQSPLSPISVASNKSGVTFVQGDRSAHPQLRPQPASLLVVIDPSVEDYQTLAKGAIDGASILILDPTQDGVEQITEYLVTQSKIQNPKSKIQSLHIVSHGSPGRLYLGNSILSLETCDRYAAHLQQWRYALSENADILLYGCQVADNSKFKIPCQQGKALQNSKLISPILLTLSPSAFLIDLHVLTGANIAASAKPTGNKALGGNWNLEVRLGAVQAPLAFREEAIAAYPATLALSPGDLAVVEFNTGTAADPRTFKILTLTNVAAGETVFFTDRGWDGSGFGTAFLADAEGSFTWTTPALAAGTVVSFSIPAGGNTVTASAGAVSGVTGWTNISTLLNPISNAGDQLFIYQGPNVDTPTTFIYGPHESACRWNYCSRRMGRHLRGITSRIRATYWYFK